MDKTATQERPDVLVDGKNAWERPELFFLGQLKDFVKGGGKTGPNFDSDPRNTAKQGVG